MLLIDARDFAGAPSPPLLDLIKTAQMLEGVVRWPAVPELARHGKDVDQTKVGGHGPHEPLIGGEVWGTATLRRRNRKGTRRSFLIVPAQIRRTSPKTVIDKAYPPPQKYRNNSSRKIHKNLHNSDSRPSPELICTQLEPHKCGDAHQQYPKA